MESDDDDPEEDAVVNRPPKRPRLDSSDEDNSSHSEGKSGSRENPIDVDLHVSVWEPTVKPFVSLFH